MPIIRQESLFLQALSEGFVSDETHVEARDRSPYKSDKVEKVPQKRGRNKKEECEQ